MRRDWPLVGAGLGIVAICAAFAGVVVLSFHMRDADGPPAPCEPPDPPAALADGCGRSRVSFDVWIGRPGMVIALTVVLALLVLAGATIRRGLRQRV